MNLFIHYIKKYKWKVTISFVLVSISVVTMLVHPRILTGIINSIVLNETETILYYGLILIALAIIGLITGIINTVITAKISQSIGKDLRDSIFKKIQGMSFSDVEKFGTSNLVIRLVNDTQQVQNLVIIFLIALLRIPIMFLGSTVLAVLSIPRLWWTIIIVLVLDALVVFVSMRLMGPRYGKIQEYIENINTIARENFIGIRVVKSLVQEDQEIKKFGDESARLTHELITVGLIYSFMYPAFYLIMDGISALIIYIVGNAKVIDPIIIGSTIEFINYIVMIMMSLMSGGMMVGFASRAFVSVGRINEVLDTPSSLLNPTLGENVEDGSISFENVTFTYPTSDTAVLTDINFKIRNGETIGIVGATGSGKSTLVHLIANIYEPNSGKITIGNHDLSTLSKKSINEKISIVLQKPIIFSGTIADTLRQGKSDATSDEMTNAARMAQALEFIDANDEKFDAPVYQRGANFSGGQKQRLSIARGLINNPKILILDDSTSALDARSEKLVMKELVQNLTDTTQIIVSQKISSIIHADNILVLDEGRLVAQGDHDHLVKSSEVYREIFETQKGTTSDVVN